MSEKAFSETTDFLISIISSAPYGIVAVNTAGHVTLVNHLAKNYLQIPFGIKEISSRLLTDCIQHIPELNQRFSKAILQPHGDFNIESFSHHDMCLNIRGRSVHGGYIITIENITHLKEMEAVALNSMFDGQEQERKRIAQDIHDGLGPLLSTVKIDLQNLQEELLSSGMEELRDRLNKTIDMVDTVTNEMRSISRHLMPKVLVDFGVAEALDSLCQRVNHSNKIKVSYYQSGFKKRFDNAIELSLYRIGQELINNSLRHSGASELTVQLIEHDNSLVLMVEDNGKGFESKSLEAENLGLGLINIESRAKALGGEFLIDSIEGKGVTATIEIPIVNEVEIDIAQQLSSSIVTQNQK